MRGLRRTTGPRSAVASALTVAAIVHVPVNRRGRLCGRYEWLSHPGALIARNDL